MAINLFPQNQQSNQNPMRNNPQLQQVMQLCQMRGMSPQQMVQNIAQQRGINLNDLLNQAQQMMMSNR